ncbi:MAG: TraR/DksA family transcriptional regulator [Bacteroidetes bacterium]|nr:MAG: TraR/DksA family transcriptional regulator [Bacteroidota bacterium]
MTEQEKAAFRNQLLEAIATVEKEIEALEEATRPIGPENAIGRISRMDAIHNKSVTEASLRDSRKKLAGLKHALSRLDSPDFGTCERCGQPIPLPRLLFLPQTTRCVRCAE